MEFIYERSLSREDALAQFAERWLPTPSTEWVMLNNAFNRVTAHDVYADVTLPVVRASARDGIAVKSASFTDGIPDASDWAYGVDYVLADTGDDFCDAFDAVVAVESLNVEGDLGEGASFTFADANLKVEPGFGVRPAGSLVKEGQLIAHAHTLLTPERVASCAVGGLSQVEVLKKPVVGFMATGSELVPWGSAPGRGQNIEANSLLVSGMLEQWGAKCFPYPITMDNRDALEATLDRALEACDIIMINGGSSRGGEDFNSYLIEERSSWFTHGIRAVPGRPIGMAIIEGKPVINIPGPVMAASLCMDWLIRGLVCQYYGANVAPKRTVKAALAQDVKKPAAFERFIRVKLSANTNTASGEPFMCAPIDATGPVESILEADGQIALPIGPDLVPAGTVVEVELFD